MKKVDRCLAQIRAIRDVAAGIDPPYVARSRIGRLGASVASLVAGIVGDSEKSVPGHIVVDSGASAEVVELVGCCNRIYHLSRHIRQPSEPLAGRWKRGWSDLLGEMVTLEEQLHRLGDA